MVTEMRPDTTDNSPRRVVGITHLFDACGQHNRPSGSLRVAERWSYSAPDQAAESCCNHLFLPEGYTRYVLYSCSTGKKYVPENIPREGKSPNDTDLRLKLVNSCLVTHQSSLISVWVKLGRHVSQRVLQTVAVLAIQLGPDAAGPRLQHLVPQAHARPAVPPDQWAAEPGARRVLDRPLVIVVGKAEAVRRDAVLVVDQQGAPVLGREAVAGVLVVAVAGGRDAEDGVVAGEDDDVLPVVAVAAQEAAPEGLVLFEVVFIPGRLIFGRAEAAGGLRLTSSRRHRYCSAGGSMRCCCPAAPCRDTGPAASPWLPYRDSSSHPG